MSPTLYIQLDSNIEVTASHVYLQDIAKLLCTDPKITNKLRILPIIDFHGQKKIQYTFSFLDLAKLILQKEPNLTISNIGEENFIITYCPNKPSNILQWFKVIFVSLSIFFGSAFSIMTFNRDADVGSLFQQIYTQITGQTSNGFTILEISYSIGIGIGVLFFFNHFGKFKFSSDPTPLQVQMCQYENNINNAIIKNAEREKKS